MTNSDPTFRTPMIVVALASTLAAAAAPAARAHEDAVLKSTASAVAAGDSLPLSGEDFSPGVSYTLHLLGALREYELQRIEGGADGKFELLLSIPRDVTPGVYSLVALAADGDRVASLDLTILEPGAETAGGVGTQEGGGHGHAAMDEIARADEMPIERAWSGAEWGAIGLLIGLAAGLGIVLIRRS